jgi:hypothetical protein
MRSRRCEVEMEDLWEKENKGRERVRDAELLDKSDT